MYHNIPKINLHLHLDGSFRLDTIWELAQKQHITLPKKTKEEYQKFLIDCSNAKNVNEYLKMFDAPLKTMQDHDSIVRITFELIEDLVSQNYAYAEIRFAPQLHTQKSLNQEQAVQAVLEGRKKALLKYPNIKIGILTCMMSIGAETLNWQENLETIEVCKKYLGNGVVGIDLAGAEGIVPLTNFAPLFEKSRAYQLPITCHAGDSQGIETIKAALDFGASRIGHGHHVYLDSSLIEEVKKRKILFELCPTSNVQCQTVPSYQEHPIKSLFDQGVHVCVNTDNDTFARVHIADEYNHCINDMGFTLKEILQMNIYAVQAAFMPESDKQSLIDCYQTKMEVLK